jgi:hypothetical protein
MSSAETTPLIINSAMLAPGTPLCKAIIHLCGDAELANVRKAVETVNCANATDVEANAALYNKLALLLEVSAIVAASTVAYAQP